MLKALIAPLAGTLALAACAGAADEGGYAEPSLLTTPAALASAAKYTLIVDVRSPEEYAQGHIPGARQIAPDAVADPDAPVGGVLRPLDEIAAIFEDLSVTPDTPVVFYDGGNGLHAARMIWLAEYLGLHRVSLLDGGLSAWSAAELPLETGSGPAVPNGAFSPAQTPRRIASADWILERRDDPGTVVIDVRPAVAFAAGHIPWAKNIPWKESLKEDLTMRSADDLRAHFEAQGVTPDKAIVVHCQNGLASAHSYVALRLLGYPRVRVYHRSWAEWGQARDLPKTMEDIG